MKRHYWSTIIFIVTVLTIIIYLVSQPELLTTLRNISFYTVAILLILRILFLLVNGLILRMFAKKFSVYLSTKEWVGIPIVTTMGNYITPFSGGMVARAAYFKYQHKFPFARFASLLASNYLVTFWTVAIVGLITLLFFVDEAQFYWQIILFFLAIILGIVLLIRVPTIRLSSNSRVFNILNTSLEGWDIIKDDKLLLTKLVAFTMINIVLNGLSFWFAYYGLGYYVSFPAALLISLLSIFSVLLNVTPGNLGIQEAIVGLSSTVLGVGVGQGILVSLLIRSATIILAFTLGPIFSYILTRNLVSSETPTTHLDISE